MPSEMPTSNTESGQDNYPPQQLQQPPGGSSLDAGARADIKAEDDKNLQGDQGRPFPDPEQNPDNSFFSGNSFPAGQALQQPVPIPQTAAAPPAQQQPTQAPGPWSTTAYPPYTAVMQMERNSTEAAGRQQQQQQQQIMQATGVVGDVQGVHPPPPLSQAHSFSSPGRPPIRRPPLPPLSNFPGAVGGAAPNQGQFMDLQQQQHHQQQQQQQQVYARNMGGFYPTQPYYQNQLPQYTLPMGLQPTVEQPYPQQPFPQLYPPQHSYYRPDMAFTLAGAAGQQPPHAYPHTAGREPPYWEGGDTSHASQGSFPQHSSSHGNAESFRFIRSINNNDVLCGRGGATNSHIGNRSFRLLVKKYKDKYLKAKKKEKPNVAGEIVDKIRSLDPPGRFLKKDRDSGYWLDIGDNRAKEKTSQALREGAPLIRRKLKEGLALTDEEGGAQSETASPEKSVASVFLEQVETGKSGDDGKRKAISPVQELKGVNDVEGAIKAEDSSSKVDDDPSSAPSPKRKKGLSEDEKTSTPPPPPLNEKPSDKNDDDNASSLSIPAAPTAQNTNAGGQNPLSPVAKGTGSNEDDDSMDSLTPAKRKGAKVTESDLTQEDRALYSVFDPPRGLKNESTEEKGEEDDKNNDEKNHPQKG